MWLALLFVLSSVLLGFAISVYFPTKKSVSTFLAIGMALGLAITTFATFLLSLIVRELDFLMILRVVIMSVGVSTALLNSNKRWQKGLPELSLNGISYGFAAALGVFLLLAYFNFLSFNVDSSGSIYSIQNAWGDYPFHVSIINSFVLRDNFPPIYPNLEGAVMRYPFLFDFLSAILIVGGLSLQHSIIIPNLLLLFALVFLARLFFSTLSGKMKYVAVFAILLFFINGNFGFLSFIEDIQGAPDVGAFLSRLPQDYSKIQDQHIEFMNLVYSVFIPQRTVLMGFALSLVAYWLLARIHWNEAKNNEYYLLAFVLALLPLIHIASFAIAGFVTAFLLAWRIFQKKKLEKPVLFSAIFGFLLILPQLLWINEQPRTETFFEWQAGWLANTTNIVDIGVFWIANTGLLIPLALIGFVLADSKLRTFYIPFALVFLAANIARFQPWDWDNIKYFAHWLLLTAFLASIALSRAFTWLAHRIRLNRFLSTGIVSIMLFISIFSGILTFMYWNNTSHVLFHASDIHAAQKVSETTEKNALFLTASSHNHFIYSLAGRQVVMGYEGHMWSHGLDYQNQRKLVNSAIERGDLSGVHGIDYVIVSPFELSKNRNLSRQIRQSNAFEVVWEYEEGNRRYELFKAVP
ncbi:hypothetical protein KJ765_02545 [Candidatus Micrarchaeota archaeon]|nr:hypothetical protein [Candidatus Micrarchaeota archaeon]